METERGKNIVSYPNKGEKEEEKHGELEEEGRHKTLGEIKGKMATEDKGPFSLSAAVQGNHSTNCSGQLPRVQSAF